VVPDLQRLFHRAGRNFESLNNERPDEQCNDNCDKNGFNIFSKNALSGIFAFGFIKLL
jgi:hypothetical protein